MRRVLEIDIVRQRGYLYPTDRLLLVPINLQFFDFRFVRRRYLMTTHAALHCRDARHTRAPGIDVTVLAGYLVISCVDLVAESDGLDRDRLFSRQSKAEHPGYKQACEPYPNSPLLHPERVQP
jgi:hypothetical protein